MKNDIISKVVIFILITEGRILTEKRYLPNFEGLQSLIPGGTVEAGESIEQALRRELREELGITALDFTPLPTNARGLNNQLLVPFIINKWEGNLPDFILDSKGLLEWVNLNDILDTPVEPVRKIIESLKKYLSL